MQFEYAPVRRRRGVEGDLLARPCGRFGDRASRSCDSGKRSDSLFGTTTTEAPQAPTTATNPPETTPMIPAAFQRTFLASCSSAGSASSSSTPPVVSSAMYPSPSSRTAYRCAASSTGLRVSSSPSAALSPRTLALLDVLGDTRTPPAQARSGRAPLRRSEAERGVDRGRGTGRHRRGRRPSDRPGAGAPSDVAAGLGASNLHRRRRRFTRRRTDRRRRPCRPSRPRHRQRSPASCQWRLRHRRRWTACADSQRRRLRADVHRHARAARPGRTSTSRCRRV